MHLFKKKIIEEPVKEQEPEVEVEEPPVEVEMEPPVEEDNDEAKRKIKKIKVVGKLNKK
jgi:hypothetical protein